MLFVGQGVVTIKCVGSSDERSSGRRGYQTHERRGSDRGREQAGSRHRPEVQRAVVKRARGAQEARAPGARVGRGRVAPVCAVRERVSDTVPVVGCDVLELVLARARDLIIVLL